MNREIKFRAWHKNNKSMCSNVTTDLLNRDYLEFMQYTGLKDVYGKDIYEGDILEVVHNGKYKEKKLIGEVIFGTLGRYQLKGENIHCAFNHLIGHDLKIIGNIHEGITR